MAGAAVDNGKCLLPTCNMPGGPLQTFKLRGITKVIECAAAMDDNETRTVMQAILDSQGQVVQAELHKNCYCSFTSKDHIKRAKKRKDGSVDCDEPPNVRSRRSQYEDFAFKKHCLFCAKFCKPVDSKHPDRWERVVQCEIKGMIDAPHFKRVVLDMCDDRNDVWGRDVAMRCNSAHDLAAAEAQYHLRCYREFRKIPVHADQTSVIDDKAMRLLIDEMYANRKMCTWTSVDLHDMSVRYGGEMTRKQLFPKLILHLGEDVVVLHVEGCASIIGFKERVGTILKIVEVDTVDEGKEDVLVRKITTEARGIPFHNKTYDLSDFTYANTKQQTSATLLRFVSKLISNGEVTKASLSVSQSIQSRITNTRNQTTLGLGVKLHHKFGSRDLIDILCDHGYIASYDEILRFRKSAAKYVGENADTLHRMMGLSRTVGIIFGWYDNFDLLVSTANGRRETHAMATEFQKHPSGIVETGSAQPGISTLAIPRLTSMQAKSVGKDRVVPLLHYTGAKKVMPPALPSGKNIGIGYNEACARQAGLVAAQEKDMQWLNSLSQGKDAIEWNGSNNQQARSQGVLGPASTYMFGPLIDAPPAHPDTVLTTLTYMQKSLLDMGMSYAHVSIDMQLFAITKQVCWYQSLQFQNVIAHPGGMHIIQSFIGCIAKLMKGSALEVYIAAAYGGLTGIFNGKSWVKAMRSFRGVSAALLKRLLSSGPKSFEQIEQYLDTARLHPTGRHWVDNFLLPTLLVHQFERAEREGDFYFKQLTMERMLKYFFLAGHVQYARYLSQYLLEMRALPTEAKADLVSGAFVCRHHEGYWNGVSADQFCEQTAIRIGKGSLKGMTLSPELVSEWIDAFPITVHVADRIDYIYSADPPGQSVNTQHKEELKHRRHLDADDRALIDVEVGKYPHPLEDSRPHLYNPVTGRIAPAEVNVSDSFLIGEQLMNKYITSLPGGFYDAISSPIKTMDVLKKSEKGNKCKSFIDLEKMFLRLLMIGQRRQIELGPLFDYELCAVPPSLIDEQGRLRKGNKSGLAKRLGVIETTPATAAEVVIVDVQQLFYRIVWPQGGRASDLVTSIQCRLGHYPDNTEKILVFDKYQEVSAKDHERQRRVGDVTVDYELSITSPLPKRDTILKSKHNKRKLANVLATFSLGENVTMETPDDGVFDHDEADITMISYVIQAATSGKDVIRVLSDDTDVFVLLVYWVYRNEMVCKVQMERWDGTVFDINATCADLGPKCLQLPGMHALSGCDSTSYPYAKGKISALNSLLDGDFPGLADVLGEVDALQSDLMEATKPFFIALYGQPPGTSMESARFRLFTKKKNSPKVKSLPPTSANLLLHVQRAHLQVMLWKAADQQAPPVESADITNFGWEILDGIPALVIAQGDPAPPQLSDVIHCQCRAHGKKCITEACSCHKERISCTTYCNCLGEVGCCNPYSKTDVQTKDDEDAEVEDIDDNVEEADVEGEIGVCDFANPDYMDDEWE